MQQYCCACIPKQICVSVESSLSGEAVSVLFGRDCTAVSGDPILYSGIVAIDGQRLTLEFRFQVVAGECSICLTALTEGTSEFYGPGTGTDTGCRVVNDTQRASPNYFCSKMLIDGVPAAWDLGIYSVSIGPANNIAISGRQDCLDSYGNLVEDTHPIRALCGNCGCICKCGCIIVYGDNRTASVYYACLGDPQAGSVGTSGDLSYTADNGIKIALGANASGCCVLSLVEYGSEDIDPTSLSDRDVPIGTVGNPCPSVIAQWNGFTNSGEAIFIDFLCAGCGCPTIRVTTCCDRQVPRVLTATITTTCGPCPTIIVSLVYDRVAAAWIGELATGMCGHGIRLALTCGDPDWTLSFTGDPCTGLVMTGSGSCHPISLTFTGSVSGISCCGVTDPFTNPDLTIVVTE